MSEDPGLHAHSHDHDDDQNVKIAWSRLAENNPGRGLVCTNKDGSFQLYAWTVATGDLVQLTDQPGEVTLGMLQSDGEYVYYLQGDEGSEIGHFVQVPFGGGDPLDLTPDVPPYASLGLIQSKDGMTIGFMTANQEGFKIFIMKDGDAPRLVFESEQRAFSPSLSNDGSILVVHSTERSEGSGTHLIAVHTDSGERIAELWDGPGSSIHAVGFSPLGDDNQVLATTSLSGHERPFVWNPATGERSERIAGSPEGRTKT